MKRYAWLALSISLLTTPAAATKLMYQSFGPLMVDDTNALVIDSSLLTMVDNNIFLEFDDDVPALIN